MASYGSTTFMASLCLIFVLILSVYAYSESNVELQPSDFVNRERDIVTSLRPPNASQPTIHPNFSFNTIPSIMLQLYTKRKNAKLKNLSKKLPRQLQDDTVRVFFPKGRKTKKIAILISELSLSFDLSAVRITEERISYAELRLHRRKSKKRSKFGSYSIAIFSRSPSLNKTKRNKKAFLGVKMFPNSRKSNWISFNVTSAVNQFLKEHKQKPSKVKIYIQVRGRVKASSSWISARGKRRPFLIVFSNHFKPSGKYLNVNLLKKQTEADSAMMQNRRKRAAESSGFYCQRQPLFVNFHSINFNWVIAPSGFTANYCQGYCPEILSSYFRPTNHAILQNLLHHKYSNLVPAANCVPTKLHSLTLLYIAEGGAIVLREFPDMVVSKCGCL